MDAHLEGLVHGVLPILLPLVGSIFVLMGVTGQFTLKPATRPILAAFSIVAATTMFGLWLALKRLKLGVDGAHAVLLVVAVLGLTGASTHMVLERERFMSNFFLLLLVALSQVVFAPRWFAASLVLIVGTWFAAASAIGWDGTTPLYAVAVIGFAIAATSLFFVRRRTLRTMEMAKLVSEEQRQALQRANDKLEEARQEAVAANAIKSQFLANMSHELRTPLNAIIGYAELIEEEALAEGDDTYVEDLGRVRTSARHLLELISNVLDLTKLDSDALTLAIESVELAPFLEEVLGTVRPVVEKNGNQVEVKFNGTMRPFDTDPLRLRQILLNLISNAAKFTEEGTITVGARELEDAHNSVELVVEDTGIGMTPAQVERVFEAFQQADSTTTRKYGGTGLGLAITKRLVERLGGTIAVTSEPGVGSRFVLWLPRS